jgi:hypothetical protein
MPQSARSFGFGTSAEHVLAEIKEVCFMFHTAQST